jgi:hypothetical protein
VAAPLPGRKRHEQRRPKRLYGRENAAPLRHADVSASFGPWDRGPLPYTLHKSPPVRPIVASMEKIAVSSQPFLAPTAKRNIAAIAQLEQEVLA